MPPRRRKAKPYIAPPPVGTMAATIEDAVLSVEVDPAVAPQPSLHVRLRLRLAGDRPLGATSLCRLVIHEAALGETPAATRNLNMIEDLIAHAGRPPLADWTTPSLKRALQGLPVSARLGRYDGPRGPMATIEAMTLLQASEARP